MSVGSPTTLQQACPSVPPRSAQLSLVKWKCRVGPWLPSLAAPQLAPGLHRSTLIKVTRGFARCSLPRLTSLGLRDRNGQLSVSPEVRSSVAVLDFAFFSGLHSLTAPLCPLGSLFFVYLG